MRLAVAGLLTVARLSWWLGITGLSLRCGACGNTRLGRRLTCCRYAALQLAQSFFQLTVAILKFLVLPGQLPELILQPLDPDLRVLVIRLRKRLG